jgi:hypothetical protein
MNNTAAKNTGIVLLVTLLWVLLYQLNMAVFHKLLFSTYVTWIFLPSGIRLISVIIFGRLGVLGLFIGALITYYLNGFTLGNPFIVATISAVNPYMAVLTSRFLLNIDDVFTELSAKKLLVISLISAAFNSFSHQLYLHLRDMAGFPSDAFVMFYGDFFGALIVMYLMSIIIKYLKYRH